MFRFSLRKLGLMVSLIGLFGGLLGFSSLATAQEPTFEEQEQVVVQTDAPSLHNVGFDNEDWYEFNERYGHYLPGSWMPDDDNNTGDTIPFASRQDWRLWYLKGTDVLEFDPEQVYAKSGEAVQARAVGPNWNVGSHLGGLYQPIYNTTPCLEYQFQIYAQARFEPPADDYVTPPSSWVNSMRVGIDRVGWTLDTDDPAVDGSFPSTTAWGTSQQYHWNYGLLSVTAEAWDDHITAFTYADADGGRSSRILWDSASFSEVTPAQIYDANNYAYTGGLSDPQYSSSIVTWSSVYPGISQVYYRAKSATEPPTGTYSYTVYLPLVNRSGTSWSATTLNKTPANYHVATLTGLQSGTTYEYFAVTKGLQAGSCATWVSAKREFTVP